MSKTIYVSIGNSDDKLTQAEWHNFASDVEGILSMFVMHGAWYSRPDARFQNACWCIDLSEVKALTVELLQGELARMAAKYRQDSIAWAEAETTFIEAQP